LPAYRDRHIGELQIYDRILSVGRLAKRAMRTAVTTTAKDDEESSQHPFQTMDENLKEA
jgi:hypothetical protein